MDAFGRNTYSKEIIDLGRVIDYLIKNYSDRINTNNIILIGHSRGGGIVLLRASIDNRISSVITWAGVSDFGSRFPVDDELKKWKADGVRYVVNGRTKQNMPHFYTFYEDFLKNKDNLNIKSAVKKIKIPFLIIHGKNDEAVNVKEALNLNKWSSNSKLELLSSTHTFGTKHPWNENALPVDMEKVVDLSLTFIK